MLCTPLDPCFPNPCGNGTDCAVKKIMSKPNYSGQLDPYTRYEPICSCKEDFTGEARPGGIGCTKVGSISAD